MPITLSYHSQDFEKKLTNIFQDHGIVVIKNLFTNDECDKYVKEIFQYFQALSEENTNISNIWYDTFEHLRIPKSIQMSSFSNIKQMWYLRSNERILNLYKILYTKINNQNYSFEDFIVSDEGIYFKPNIEGVKENVDNNQKSKFLIRGHLNLTNSNICTYLSDHRISEKIENCRGSFIIYSSNISNYFQIPKKKEISDKNDKWKGWTCMFFISRKVKN